MRRVLTLSLLTAALGACGGGPFDGGHPPFPNGPPIDLSVGGRVPDLVQRRDGAFNHPGGPDLSQPLPGGPDGGWNPPPPGPDGGGSGGPDLVGGQSGLDGGGTGGPIDLGPAPNPTDLGGTLPPFLDGGCF